MNEKESLKSSKRTFIAGVGGLIYILMDSCFGFNSPLWFNLLFSLFIGIVFVVFGCLNFLNKNVKTYKENVDNCGDYLTIFSIVLFVAEKMINIPGEDGKLIDREIVIPMFIFIPIFIFIGAIIILFKSKKS